MVANTKEVMQKAMALAQSQLNPPAKIDLNYIHGDEGRAFYVKGHVPLDAFMDAVRQEVEVDDVILSENPSHLWMRVCRDFQEEISIFVEAAPHTRGAFMATWIQEN